MDIVRQEVYISLSDGTKMLRPAQIVAGFAVHRVHYHPKAWAITHIPSGCAALYGFSEKEAIGLAKVLGKVEWGGVKFADLPACEACANLLAIAEQVKKLAPKVISTDEQIVENARNAAKALDCAKEVMQLSTFVA